MKDFQANCFIILSNPLLARLLKHDHQIGIDVMHSLCIIERAGVEYLSQKVMKFGLQ
jgi:hypothetical protein